MGPSPQAAQDWILDREPSAQPQPIQQLLAAAVKQTGRSADTIISEMEALWQGPGGVKVDEYFKLALYEPANLSSPLSKFVGERGMREIWGVANHSALWFGPMMDKIAFQAILSGFGLRVTQIFAQYGGGALLPGCRQLSDRDDILALLSDPAHYPLFCKPRFSERSYGSASLLKRDGDNVVLLDGRSVKAGQFADEIVTYYHTGYLFQKRIEPHPEVARLCGARPATVRVYTLRGPKGLQIFRMAWKIPAGSNMADNYWRKGNILAAIDPVSGLVNRAITGYGFEQSLVEHHPDSKIQIVGMAVPDLARIKELALKAAEVFHGLNLVGWDIAATIDGPMLVEGNFAPDFDLVQLAEGRGVIDPQLLDALEWCHAEQAQFAAKVTDAQSKH